MIMSLALAILGGLSHSLYASPSGLVQVSSDPYTDADSQHRSEVEPSTAAYGATIVSAFQVGRCASGGASNIGWASSRDGGATWSQGFLSGITTNAGGVYPKVSDASVAYDRKHSVWLISSLPVGGSPKVLINRSTDDGQTFGPPIDVASDVMSLDKNWTVCDNAPASPYFGHCYTEWDRAGAGDVIQMATSTDGGLTWSAPLPTSNNAGGVGGQPVTQPDGTVIVPISSSLGNGQLVAFASHDGGATWTAPVKIADVVAHDAAGGLRTEPIPSARVDASGVVYVAWQDCRFEAACAANDIVMARSPDGVTWSAPVRVPTDPVGRGVDHMIPGLAVGATNAGAVELQLTYYFYPHADCDAATCQIGVASVYSLDGGASWTKPVVLASPIAVNSLPNTSLGRMVGDYIASTLVDHQAHAVFATADGGAGAGFAISMVSAQVSLAPGKATTSVTDDPVLVTEAPGRRPFGLDRLY